MGIHIKGRKRQLNIIYRNTKEIAGFANRFRYGITHPGEGTNQQHALFADPRISNGPCPVLKQFSNIDKVLTMLPKR